MTQATDNTTNIVGAALNMQHAVTHATFLGLSPESRSNIYKFTLTAAETLHIAVLTPTCRIIALIDIVRSPDKSVGGSSILRASKLIYREARSIFYSQNIFHFMEPQALRIFASCIGDNKAMLRHVQLQIWRLATTRAALKALYPTPSLRSLDITVPRYKLPSSDVGASPRR